MHPSSRRKIRIILDGRISSLESRLADVRAALQGNGLNENRYIPAATFRQTARDLEDIGRRFVTEAVDHTLEVSGEPEAYAMVREALELALKSLRELLEDCFGARSFDNGDTRLTARDIFLTLESKLNRQAETHRMTFVRFETLTPRVNVPGNVTRNKGGKPLAEHWDDMWAEVAVQLFNGDFDPKTQADVERTMKEFFARHDVDIGDTAVRGRARRLWQKLQDAN